MPPAAAAAPAPDPVLEAAFQTTCEAVAALSVAVLDEKQPERDWHRWQQALFDVVATRPIFKAELDFTGNLTAITALTAAQLANDDLSVVSLAGPTLQQRRQLALRALINNSLLEGGDARELIKDCAFASGVVAGVPQAFASLKARYSTTKLPDDLNAEAVGLLQPKWPSKVDPTDYQAMVSEKIRVAKKLGFDASNATRAIWWPVISSPPKGHPMHAAAEMAYARTNGEHATVAHRDRFITVMLEELQRNHAAQTRSANEQRLKRSLLAEAHASLAQGEFDANAVYRPHPPDKGSAMPSPAPGGGLVRHPCARGCKIAHAFGYKCDVEVECNACGSDNHIDDYCWIKHGLKAHNLRLPPVVAEQYEKWHQQQLKGEYVKVPGGPPRVRLGRTARPQSAPSSSSLATISEDEDEYNGLYCGSAADDAHEPIKWVQAVRVQSASITAKRPLATFTFPGAGMVESFGASEVEVVSRYGDSIEPSVTRRADADAALAAEETAAAERRAAVAAAIAAAEAAAQRADADAAIAAEEAATAGRRTAVADAIAAAAAAAQRAEEVAALAAEEAAAAGRLAAAAAAIAAAEKDAEAAATEGADLLVVAPVTTIVAASPPTAAGASPTTQVLDTVRVPAGASDTGANFLGPAPAGDEASRQCGPGPLPAHARFSWHSLRRTTVASSMPRFVFPIYPGAVVAGVVAALFAAVFAALSFTDRAVRDGLYFLAVVVAVLSIGYVAVSFVPVHPVGAFTIVPCLSPPSASTVVYQAFDASVLVDAFDASTSNATSGDVLVCVDTGADMLCLTSTTNTRVLQWSPEIVVRVANSDVVPVDALVETVVHFPVSGRKAVLRRGLVSSQFKKVLLSGPALAEAGIETRTARGPKFGGFLEWDDGGLEPFDGPPYRMVVLFTAPDGLDTTEILAVRTDDATVLLWHERIGHAGNSTLSRLHDSTDGTPFTKSIVLPHECEHCLANKAIRRHLAAHGITATRVGQLTHIDVHGPYAEDIYFGARYDICFCDDFSNVRYVMSIPDSRLGHAAAGVPQV